MNIKRIAENLNVSALQWALRDPVNQGLWNVNTQRTESNASPHHGVDDIYARYAQNPNEQKPHDSVWYESAITPLIKAHAWPLMQFVEGERLGGILITRVPPFGQVKPHVDSRWHAHYYKKFAIQIEAAPGQAFCFDDESLETKPGDVYFFNNQARHWVTNPTNYPRVTMIVCIRTDKEF